MDWEKLLKKLGYGIKCKHCGNTILYIRGLVGDALFFSLWAVMLYLYFTVELPYIHSYANCSMYLYEIMGKQFKFNQSYEGNITELFENLIINSSNSSKS